MNQRNIKLLTKKTSTVERPYGQLLVFDVTCTEQMALCYFRKKNIGSGESFLQLAQCAFFKFFHDIHVTNHKLGV